MTTEVATLAGGCFWCLEAVFDQLAGVRSVESGYMGGDSSNPSYEEVCSGQSGHAEVVRLGFDPSVVSFRDILAVFFTIHDPTTPDRQGNDRGTQYRSAIFFHTPEQELAARETIARLGARGSAEPDRHRGGPGRHVLAGRGLPPGVLRARGLAEPLLHARGGAQGRQVPQALPRSPEEALNAGDGRIALPCGSSVSFESSPRSVATVSTNSSAGVAARSCAWRSAWRSSGPTGPARAGAPARRLPGAGPRLREVRQLLSIRPDLIPTDITDELSKLQDSVPPFPADQVVETLDRSYGKPYTEVFRNFNLTCVASASVAQVHFAELPDGREVAVKILRPHIAETIDNDTGLLYVVAGLIERLHPLSDLLRAREVVVEFDKIIHDELDLLREASSMSTVRRNFAGSSIHVRPDVHFDWCTRDVMVMERIDAIPVKRPRGHPRGGARTRRSSAATA